MSRFLFLFTSCFLMALNLFGRNSHYSYTQLSIGEGLSQASVESILLDHKGNLWIGTKNGLNHYSQQTIKNFFHSPKDRHSLPDDRIIHLEEDSLGNIWIGTPKGLALYDKEKQNFRDMTRGWVQSSCCIPGGVLFGGENVLYFYDYEKQELERIHIQPESPEVRPIQYRVLKILPYGENQVILNTRTKGLFIYNYQTGLFRPFTTDIPWYLQMSFCVASDRSVYASFYGVGVYHYAPDGTTLGTYHTNNSALNNNYVLDLIEHENKIWMATDGGGINLLHTDTQEISHLTHITGDPSSLPVNSIIKLYKDNHENLWMGTVRGGVYHIKESYIKTYQDVVFNHPSGLSEKSVTSFYEEKDGRLWVGTDGGGINLYDPETDRFTHFPQTQGDKVVSITWFSEDELLVSLYTKGLYRFNKKTGTYHRFLVVDEDTDRNVCFYGYIPLAHQVSEDKIYIIGNGAWVYHCKERKFSPLLLPEKYRNQTAALMLVHRNDEFSLLKQENLVYKVDPKNDSIQFLFEARPNETIFAMEYEAENQTIWVGSNYGLHYYHLKEQQYKPVPTQLFNYISFLTMDRQGRLWICAHNKLFSYSIAEKKFTSWNHSDGYLPNEILFKYHNTCNKDYVYLGGSEGMVRIATSIQSKDNESPQVYLEDVLYNGQSHISGIENHEMEIPWNYQSIVFTFGVKSEDVFQKHLLKYTIKDGSNENTFESYDPQLNLSSLSPGTYTLFASCYTKDGSETSPVPIMKLTVTPPWYKSRWFMTLLVGLFMGITFGIARWIYRKKTRRMKGDVGEFLQTVLQSLDKPETMETEMPKPALNEADRAFLEKMDKLIHDNLSNDELSAKFLTDHLAMSRASLYNKVKALTGMGVNDYINRIRIERSVYLLTNTDMSINEISYEVGFSYPRYFSTSFKQVKGMTPTRFKEENKKK